MADVKLAQGRGGLEVRGDMGLPKLNQGRRGRRKGLDAAGSQAIRERVAVLRGMGVSTTSIAKQLGITTRRVEYILKDDLATNKNGLRDLQQATLAKHHPIANATADKMLKAMDKGVDLYEQFAGTPDYEQGPTLREVAYSYGMLAEHVLYPNHEEAPPPVRTSVNIDLKDPEAVKALFAVMRGEPPALPEPIDVTPEK